MPADQQDVKVHSVFYNLAENPFGETPDTRFYFESRTHARALDGLQRLVREGRGFAVLTGEVGAGKTLLSRILLRAVEREADTALILFPQLNEHEFLGSLLDELGDSLALEPAPGRSELKARIDRIYRKLIDNASRGRRTLLVIDEAQHLPLPTLEAIRLLTNLETERRKLLQIVLIGQPELDHWLERPETRQISQRITIHERLAALDESETDRYIRHRIDVAGGANYVRFEERTIRWLHRRTAGVPRLINRDCERLLAAGERAKKHLISVDFARSILEPDRVWSSDVRDFLQRLGVGP